MTTLQAAPRPVTVERRVSWRLSPDGRIAVCTVLAPQGAPLLEVRAGGTRLTHEVPRLGATSQLLVSDTGAIRLCHHRGGRHLVEVLTPGGELRPLAESTAQGLALVDDDHALEFDAGGFSRLVRIEAGGLVPVARFDGPAVGAVGLGAGRLAVDVLADGHCTVVAVDLTTHQVTPFVSVSERSDDHVVDYVPAANLLVVATDATGHARLGIGYPDEAPVTFPAALHGAGPATHVATAPDGSRLAVAFAVGAASELRVVDLPTGTTRPLDLPGLVVIGRGALRDDELVVPVSTPDRPATLLRVDLASGRHEFDDEPLPGVRACHRAVHPGAGGDVESIVLGDPARAETVVIALHGGPLSSWPAMFDPLLAELAAAGVAVVAPNVRGSVGYGREHAMAIVGDWGGPDLADVLAVAGAVTARRAPGARPPVLLGISYGAYLALLAAQCDAPAWSGCVALAPFVSGARVAAHGGPVAELVRRLGGLTSPDLRKGLRRTRVPVLLLHGEQDDVVPVAESRLLAAQLRRHGAAVDLHVRPDAGHELLAGPVAVDVVAAITGFCLDPAAGHPNPATGHLRSSVRRAEREEERT